MRICTKCFETHPETFFNKDRSRDDGLYPQCKNCSRAACKRVYRKYNDKHVAANRKWKAQNPELHRAINLRHRRGNLSRYAQYAAKYKAALKRATPDWADTDLIAIARDLCPEGFHVDHVFPLQHKDFCGLNTPDNLQVIPAAENFSKGNRIYPKYLKGLEKFAIL